jgi:hypothetical protein
VFLVLIVSILKGRIKLREKAQRGLHYGWLFGVYLRWFRREIGRNSRREWLRLSNRISRMRFSNWSSILRMASSYSLSIRRECRMYSPACQQWVRFTMWQISITNCSSMRAERIGTNTNTNSTSMTLIISEWLRGRVYSSIILFS